MLEDLDQRQAIPSELAIATWGWIFSCDYLSRLKVSSQDAV